MSSSKKVLFFIFLVGLAVSIALFIASSKQIEGQGFPFSEVKLPVVQQRAASPIPTPSPLPFAEMTIPGLRQRSYQSSLGELQRRSENSSYTSYLASYNSDGFKVNGQLTVPKGEKPVNGWPAIIFIHGYIPPAQYQTFSNYSAYVDYLAKNGFVVFKIDLRGHANSEGEPGGGYYSADYVIDVLNAYSALQASDLVDKNGIGLWGHSMAGNVVLRSLAVEPEIPAAVIWAGAVYSYQDMRDLGIDDNSYRPPSNAAQTTRRRTELFNIHGQFSSESAFWRQVAPTNYLNDLQGAIEVHHALDDSVVSIEYSRGLMKLLDQTSVPHKLFEYRTGGHNISGSSFNQAMQRTSTFFKEKLQ